MRGLSILGCLVLFTAACSDRDAGGGEVRPPSDSGGGDGTGAGGDGVFGGVSDGTLTARIVRPNGNVSILDGAALTFEAEFADGALTVGPDVVWSSSLAGELGRVNPLRDVVLGAGIHQVTVSGTLGSRTATAQVTVVVSDFAVRIVAPDHGSDSTTGELVSFRAEARLAEGGGQTQLVTGTAGAGQRLASYVWSSDRDGLFGTATQLNAYAGLSAGAHVITVTVTDDQAGGTGRSASAAIGVIVSPPNTRPSVAITSPSSCPVDLQAGDTLTLTGSVTDPDAADVGLSGSWSDAAGPASGSGSSFAFVSSVLGKHAIVFAAVDAQGARDEAICEVFVVAAGQSRASLFPSMSAYDAALPGGDTNVRWVGSDGAGRTLAGNDEGLVVFEASGAAAGTYDGDQLGGGGAVQVNDAVVAGASIAVATDQGVAVCTYDAGALSACVRAHDQDADAVALAGELVAAAVDGGLYLGRVQGGAVTAEHVFHTDNGNLPSNDVADVLFIGTSLYVATNEGLCVIDDAAAALAAPAGGPCDRVLDDDNSVLPSKEVTALAADGDRLWIGTSEGVALLDLATGQMVALPRPDGRVNDIAIDAEGIVWIATSRGVDRLDPSTGAIMHLDARDWGRPDGSRNVRSILIDGNGDKWFATPDGLVRYVGA